MTRRELFCELAAEYTPEIALEVFRFFLPRMDAGQPIPAIKAEWERVQHMEVY